MFESRNNSAQVKQLTSIDSVLIGSTAGMTDVLTTHGLWTMKLRSQRGDPFTLNPKLLYRGFWTNAMSTIPNTALQISLDHSFTRLITSRQGTISAPARTSAAIFAGIGAALVSCPTEMVMTYQSINKVNFYTALQNISKPSIATLFRGFPATTLREGSYTGCLLALNPALKEKLQPHLPNKEIAALTSGFTAGGIATLVTQPVDAIKTFQQSLPLEHKSNFKAAAETIYTQKKLAGFFKGALSRTASVALGIIAITEVKEKMESRLLK